MQPNKVRRKNWNGKPESLLAHTFAETLKTSKKKFFFLEIPKKGLPETLEISSTITNSIVGGNPSYILSI